MMEDIGTIISNGFGTYTKNINICVPFILSFFFSVLFGILIIVAGFSIIFGSSLMNLEHIKTPEEIISILNPIITQHTIEIIFVFLIVLLVFLLIQAYFISGAIGMAIQATESGTSNISSMKDAGRKNIINMFLAEILFSLLSLAGIVFTIPGAMKVKVSWMFTSDNLDALALLFGGFLIWGIYFFILNLLLAVFRYALVADNIGPLDSMAASLDFFKKNKMDVFLLSLFIIFITFALIIFDYIMGSIPIINSIWQVIYFMISLIVVPPLTTIWWVRLYLGRTARKLFIDDLLAHPDDLITEKYS